MSITLPDVSLLLILYVAAVLMVGGLVKGISGFGLPLTTIPLLALVIPVPTAISWTLLPLLISQIMQMLECRRSAGVLRAIWPLMASLGVTLIVSVQLLTVFDPRILMVIVGILIQVFVVSQLLPQPPQLPARRRSVVLALAGMASGGVAGVTSFYGFPAVQALLSLGLAQSEFIFATSATFFVGGIIMGLSLDTMGLIGSTDIIVSVLGLVPTLLGMELGRRIRQGVSVGLFKAMVLSVLSATGFAMIIRATF